MSVAVIGLHARSMVSTETGYLGLAPKEVKVGDVVAILFGCSYSVVLRPCRNAFKYIGECYVDGMMDGEAVEAVDCGKFQVQDFLIV